MPAAVPPCPPPCPPPCLLPTPTASSDAIICPQPANPIVFRPCTVSTFVNVAHNFCLDSDNTGKVDAVACTGTRSQQWVFTGSNATSVIRNLATGLCLTGNDTGGVITASCRSVTPLANADSWFVTQSGGPVIDSSQPGRCLDSPLVPGSPIAPVDTRLCDGTSPQLWTHK